MKKQAATIGLGAFLLADIVLVALALRPPAVPSGAPQAGSTVGASTQTPVAPPTTGTTTTQPSATTTTRPPTTPAVGPVPVQRLVVGLDADTAWRATVGTCRGGRSSIEVTTDGGKNWTEGTSPARAIARIQPLQIGSGFVLAAGPDCTLREWTTADNTATWTGPKAIVGGWARQLSEPAAVLTPANPAARPCGTVDVIDLSRTSAEQAEALCADGEVKVTNDGGASWTDSGTATGAVALANRLEGQVLSTYAARLEASCAGVQVVRVVQGRPATAVACVQTSSPPAPGQVGISASAQAGWLVVGDQTWTAGADLAEWQQA